MLKDDSKFLAKLARIIKRLFELEKNTALGRLNIGVTALVGLVFFSAFLRSCTDPIVEGMAYHWFGYTSQQKPTLEFIGELLFKIFIACAIMLFFYDIIVKWINEIKH